MSVEQPIRPIPLNTGGPTDPEHMVGREAELRRIFDAFGSVGVVLTGERRLGKTSLAMLVALEARRIGWDVIRQSAEGYTTLEQFSTALVSRLDEAKGRWAKAARALRERWTLKAPGVQIAPAAAPRLLEDVVTTAVKASDERLLLVLDELPVLARELERVHPGSGIAMLHMLRRLRQEHPNRLRMLCLGSIGFHHAIRGESQGALNDLDPQRLGPLAQGDATYLAACIFCHARAPQEYVKLAPVIAEQSEGAPYYVHQLVADVLRDHPRGCAAADVERIVAAAIADPDNRWDLRHYVDRIESYYGHDAPLARAVLDAVATEPSGLSLAELLPQLAAHGELAPIDDERVRDVLRRLDADHYLARDGERRKFAFSLIRRAWIGHRT
jgi:hypothetical protein